jgi:hypothetical protein
MSYGPVPTCRYGLASDTAHIPRIRYVYDTYETTEQECTQALYDVPKQMVMFKRSIEVSNSYETDLIYGYSTRTISKVGKGRKLTYAVRSGFYRSSTILCPPCTVSSSASEISTAESAGVAESSLPPRRSASADPVTTSTLPPSRSTSRLAN